MHQSNASVYQYVQKGVAPRSPCCWWRGAPPPPPQADAAPRGTARTSATAPERGGLRAAVAAAARGAEAGGTKQHGGNAVVVFAALHTGDSTYPRPANSNNSSNSSSLAKASTLWGRTEGRQTADALVQGLTAVTQTPCLAFLHQHPLGAGVGTATCTTSHVAQHRTDHTPHTAVATASPVSRPLLYSVHTLQCTPQRPVACPQLLTPPTPPQQ